MNEKLKQWIVNYVSQFIRVGFVSGRDEKRMRVRVRVTDTVTNELVTDWLQVIVPRAKKDRCYDLPDIGDQVLCVFLPFAAECGFVLGSMYGEDAPPVAAGDKCHRVFEDGTVLEYDRAAHLLTADVQGDAVVKTTQSIKAVAGTTIDAEAVQHISMTAPHIYQNGNVTTGGHSSGTTATVTEKAHRTIEGSLTVQGPVVIDGDVEITGNLTVNGNSSVSGKSYAASRSGGGI